jgi:sn-glycerol 3-phosphate transport system permease protein
MKASIHHKKLTAYVLWYIPLILAAVIILYPIYTILNISLLSDPEVATYPPKLFPSGFFVENFTRAMELAPLGRYLFNSVLQSSMVMIGQIITASLAAYAFAFINFKYRNFFFLVFLATMMIPWEATIIPNYLIIKQWGLTDTFWGLATPFMATGFGTFLLRQFFMKIPHELRDAAEIDGCGSLRFLWTIVLPLARPAMGTLAVYSFLQTYNQYLWPLLITNDQSMRTVQIGLTLLQDEEHLRMNIVAAGVMIILVPTFVLFVFSNKQLIRGLTAGAVKG